MRSNAVFIDHSYHKKTKASGFLKDILSEYFCLDSIYDESWNGGKRINIDELLKYDYIFYFQYIHDPELLKKIIGKKIVWIPMYDGLVGMSDVQLLNISAVPMKVIVFSKTLYKRLKGLGFHCFYLQYFPDPRKYTWVKNYSSKRVYFWYRIPEINLGLIGKLLHNEKIKSFIYINNPDPPNASKVPTSEEVKQFKPDIYKGFLKRELYDSLVSSANIYIAPRVYEGIGMSFLEAMARGQCVIAMDNPTMNEYITHGYNGILYKKDSEEVVNIQNFEKIGRNAQSCIRKGYKEYVAKRDNLKTFILDEHEKNSSRLLPLKLIYFKLKEKLTPMI